MWLVAVDDDACEGTVNLTGQRLVFSCSMVLMDKAQGWTRNVDDEKGSSIIGATLAACLWSFPLAVKYSWSPAFGEESRGGGLFKM